MSGALSFLAERIVGPSRAEGEVPTDLDRAIGDGDAKSQRPGVDTRRVASTQRLFRAVNERIRNSNRVDDKDLLSLLCECGQDDCVAVIKLGLDGFDEIASQRNRFIVDPDHLVPEVDRLIESRGGFAIVEQLPGS